VSTSLLSLLTIYILLHFLNTYLAPFIYIYFLILSHVVYPITPLKVNFRCSKFTDILGFDEISSPHSDEYEDVSLLGCCIV
jgi:hypothetical protein